MTLTEIDQYIGGLSNPREAHQGVFNMCSGDLNVQYLGENIQTQDIEKLILNEYAYREMSFETVEQFHQYFTNCWNRYFLVMRENLENVPEFSLNEAEESATENTSATSESNINNNGKSKFSNTPNEYIAGDGIRGLTTYTEGDSTAQATATGEGNRNLNTTKKGNIFEKWLSLSKNNRNVIFDFINKFEYMFLNSRTIQNFRRDYNGY